MPGLHEICSGTNTLDASVVRYSPTTIISLLLCHFFLTCLSVFFFSSQGSPGPPGPRGAAGSKGNQVRLQGCKIFELMCVNCVIIFWLLLI